MLWLATQQMADLQKADLLEEFKTNVFLNIILGANVKSMVIFSISLLTISNEPEKIYRMFIR